MAMKATNLGVMLGVSHRCQLNSYYNNGKLLANFDSHRPINCQAQMNRTMFEAATTAALQGWDFAERWKFTAPGTLPVLIWE